MERVINKRNAAGQLHGYWDVGGWKVHYYNDVMIGYIGYYESNRFKYHYTIEGKEIGYETHHQSQCLYSKPGIKFGEKITWKE